MSIRSRKPLAFALFLAFTLPATAQQLTPVEFTPNPAPQGVNVRMSYVINRPGCGEVVRTTVVRTGNALRADFVLGVPPGNVCFATPPPTTTVELDLGGYPPGIYTVTAFGTDENNQQFVVPVVSGTFGVVATSTVPAISPTLAALLGMLAAVAGGVALHRRAAR